jgi:hypothetical protein
MRPACNGWLGGHEILVGMIDCTCGAQHVHSLCTKCYDMVAPSGVHG